MSELPQKVARAMRIAHAMFGKDPRVTGIDYGYAYRGKQRSDELCIRIHVDEKKASDRCKPLELVPSEIGGIRTDVVERRYRHSAGPANLVRGPVQPGRGVGNPKGRAGTIGLIVFDNGRPAILSCYHVLAGGLSAEVGEPILQPAVEAGGKVPNDVVAKLHRFFPQGLWGDAATALLNADCPFETKLMTTGVEIKSTIVPSAGILVDKVGSTTGLTSGLVEGTGDYRIEPTRFMMSGMQIAGLDDDKEISLSGDSGAVWYERATLAGVGLHVAGGIDDVGHGFALACSLETAIDTLGVTLTAPMTVASPVKSP